VISASAIPSKDTWSSCFFPFCIFLEGEFFLKKNKQVRRPSVGDVVIANSQGKKKIFVIINCYS
jgi:hypothetical protein